MDPTKLFNVTSIRSMGNGVGAPISSVLKLLEQEVQMKH